MSDPNEQQFLSDRHPLTCPSHSGIRLTWVGGLWRCPSQACEYTQEMTDGLRRLVFFQALPPELTQAEQDYIDELEGDDE